MDRRTLFWLTPLLALGLTRQAQAASVVLTNAQIAQIARHFVQTQFTIPDQTAVAALDDIETAISTLAMSISIGAGTVSFSPAFTPPISNMSAAAQASLICYIVQVAMGVPLLG